MRVVQSSSGATLRETSVSFQFMESMMPIITSSVMALTRIVCTMVLRMV